MIAKNYQSSLESFNCSIRVVFDFVDLVTPKCLLSKRESGEFPGVIEFESMNLLCHSITPPGFSDRLRKEQGVPARCVKRQENFYDV